MANEIQLLIPRDKVRTARSATVMNEIIGKLNTMMGLRCTILGQDFYLKLGDKFAVLDLSDAFMRKAASTPNTAQPTTTGTDPGTGAPYDPSSWLATHGSPEQQSAWNKLKNGLDMNPGDWTVLENMLSDPSVPNEIKQQIRQAMAARNAEDLTWLARLLSTSAAKAIITALVNGTLEITITCVDGVYHGTITAP